METKSEGEHVFLDIETTGLYPIVHRVVCIGYARGADIEAIIDRDERKMLEQFLDWLRPDDTLVGFNLGFDYGFLVLRSLKHGLNPTRLISCEQIDLMDPIVNLLEGKRVGLHALGDFFGIKYEPTSGKLIPEQWETGDHKAIKKHCLDDVKLTVQLFKRLKPILFEPATAKQLKYLRSLGVKFEEGITKAEASRLIDEAIRKS